MTTSTTSTPTTSTSTVNATLTSAEIRHFQALGNHLKTIIWVGQKGISEPLLEAIRLALKAHELIKIKFLDKDAIDDSLPSLLLGTKATHVQTLGKTVILYRHNPEKKKNSLKLQINKKEEQNKETKQKKEQKQSGGMGKKKEWSPKERGKARGPKAKTGRRRIVRDF